MLKVHQDIIRSNLSTLVEQTDLNALVRELLRRDVFNSQMIPRILNPSRSKKLQKTDLYLEILKRGPQAFAKLQDALIASNHLHLADTLRLMDIEQSSRMQRSSSLNSVGSNLNTSDNDYESDGPFHSVPRKTVNQNAQRERPNMFPPTTSGETKWENDPHKTPDVSDFQRNLNDPHGKVFAAPSYGLETFDEDLKKLGLLSPDDKLVYSVEKNRPVTVKCATHWQNERTAKTGIYKMNSNPRGCALLINNWKFNDSITYPERIGSDNDVNRMIQLLKQLHFTVENYENKSKAEMDEIVGKFSQKSELNVVDCIWVTLMSHGEQGDTYEDNEIVGVDGIGYRTDDIVARFYNDSCSAAINKPKLFFFQACRGCLVDPGVEVGNLNVNLSHRVATDGRRVHPPQRRIKVRTQSDIFVAYPTPYGYMANRDNITGAWFIQAVIDIFSEHAHDTHLEDLLKMVDASIKEMNNLYPSNFQAITTKSVGWNKHLYFNPGLYKDTVTGATVRIGNPFVSSQVDEGMDVVDVSSTNSDKCPNGVSYSRFKDDETDADSDSSGKYDCFNLSSCKLS